MTHAGLIPLLHRVRDGVATDEELGRARELAAGDDRLPVELREAGLLVDDPVEDAVALLALLDSEPLFGLSLGEALRAEAGEIDDAITDVDPEWAPLGAALRDGLVAAAHGIDVSAAVLVALGGHAEPVGDAVRAEAGSADVAAAVERILVVASVPVADALRREAGRIDVADSVLAAIGLTDASARFVERLPVAEAVRHEAGTADLAAAILEVAQPAWLSALIDGELGPDAHRVAARALMRDPSLGAESTALAELAAAVRRGVTEAAGTFDAAWPQVARAIGVSEPEAVAGWDETLLGEAVRAEAGTVDVRAAVMSRVHGAAVRRSSLGTAPAAPAAANTTASAWRAGLLAMAAAMLVAVIGGRFLGDATAPASPDWDLQFASASEIVVNDVVSGDASSVMVFHEEDDNAPLIIWVDEEAML